jgi:muramoyltetrapeptide carboxypeptidase LdcA involved in peptidoglycan recycling
MGKPRIHVFAPAGSLDKFFAFTGLSTASETLAMFQRGLGDRYEVTGDAAILEAVEDDYNGGRHDDDARAREMTEAMADDDVTAMLSIRGGAWLTRVLPRIDFSVLSRRTRPLHVFGFSELTTLVNIVGAYPNVYGVYDMGPAFLVYGLKRFSRLSGLVAMDDAEAAEAWTRERFPAEFAAFLADVVEIIEGRGTRRPLTAALVRGELPDRSEATFVGGNVAVWTSMAASPFMKLADPAGRWVVLEEIGEIPERIDRYIAQLTVSGVWERCAGLLLGDFHMKDECLTPAVVQLLAYHLPRGSRMPVLVTDSVGHIWPMAPLVMQRPCKVERQSGSVFRIHSVPTASA